MHRRTLSIVLAEDISFEALVAKLGEAFHAAFSSENRKGRRIADAETADFDISLIDRVDDLGEFLSDEEYVVDIVVGSDDLFNSGFEGEIRKSLETAGIKWQRGVWSRLSRGEEVRIFSRDPE